jgi:signal peptide peptidase-like protein 2B
MNDPNNPNHQIHQIKIPALYITMKEADLLLKYMNGSQNGDITLAIYTRWYPKYNLSTIVIWAVGVFVAALASYLSAGEIRHARKMIENGRSQEGGDSDGGGSSSDGDGANETSTAVSVRGYEPVSGTGEGQPQFQQQYRSAIPPEETLELAPEHAIFFILFSSAGLLTLFFFKIYNVVKIFYAFGCSGAIMQLIVIPFYHAIARKLNIRDRVAFTTDVAEIGAVTVLDILSITTAYGIGTVWIYMAFAFRHPETIPFFWIMQNIMGASMCILFLQTMKLNSIKVASILLTAAFFYDIFFVFVTPLLTKGGKSIMVDVATSGGPPTADPNWCEKYPDGKECQGGGM